MIGKCNFARYGIEVIGVKMAEKQYFITVSTHTIVFIVQFSHVFGVLVIVL